MEKREVRQRSGLTRLVLTGLTTSILAFSSGCLTLGGGIDINTVQKKPQCNIIKQEYRDSMISGGYFLLEQKEYGKAFESFKQVGYIKGMEDVADKAKIENPLAAGMMYQTIEDMEKGE
ncbi:MAG: hypothetical protein AABX30_01895 [Nanoarchaeota archaeon]